MGWLLQSKATITRYRFLRRSSNGAFQLSARVCGDALASSRALAEEAASCARSGE
jgi:hypothetical protein